MKKSPHSAAAREERLGALEIMDTATVEDAKTAYRAAKAKIETITPLNVPEWRHAETTIDGHEVTVRADHPAGQQIAGRVTLTRWTAHDGDGKALQFARTITRPGGASAIQWQAKIPAGTAYPVKLAFGARNLCGPSSFALEIADPGA